MYKTPLQSSIDKNKVSNCLSLLLPINKKIKFAWCNDLIIENSFYNPQNEHYFSDFLLCEFWYNYNNNRKYLYQNVKKHLSFGKKLIQSNMIDIMGCDSINRSAIFFISNFLSKNKLYMSDLDDEIDLEKTKHLFVKTNKVQDFLGTGTFKDDGEIIFLECTSYDSYIKDNFYYFQNIIDSSDNIFILSDVPVYIKKFKKTIHINKKFYLCYDKESK